MQLDKQQKEDLKSLTEHRGFKVLEQIARDKEEQLFSMFKRKNVGEEKVLHEITCAQNVLSGMEYLLNTAKAKTKWVTKAPDMN